MNIFWLDKEPAKAVKAIYDIHLTKQVLEIAQLLGTISYDTLGEQWSNTIMSLKHRYHPICEWMKDSMDNMNLAVHFAELCLGEYTAREGAENQAGKYISGAKEALKETSYPSQGLTLPPIVMSEHPECHNPEWPKNWDSVVAAYRYLYVGPKWHLRGTHKLPDWALDYRSAYLNRSSDPRDLKILG